MRARDRAHLPAPSDPSVRTSTCDCQSYPLICTNWYGCGRRIVCPAAWRRVVDNIVCAGANVTLPPTRSAQLNPLASMRWHQRISCARGNDGDLHQSGQQSEYPLRDAVMRRTVRFPARAGRIGNVHVRSSRSTRHACYSSTAFSPSKAVSQRRNLLSNCSCCRFRSSNPSRFSGVACRRADPCSRRQRG